MFLSWDLLSYIKGPELTFYINSMFNFKTSTTGKEVQKLRYDPMEDIAGVLGFLYALSFAILSPIVALLVGCRLLKVCLITLIVDHIQIQTLSQVLHWIASALHSLLHFSVMFPAIMELLQINTIYGVYIIYILALQNGHLKHLNCLTKKPEVVSLH